MFVCSVGRVPVRVFGHRVKLQRGGTPYRTCGGLHCTQDPRSSERAARDLCVVLIVIGDDQVHGVSSLGQSIGSQSVFLAVESRMKRGGRGVAVPCCGVLWRLTLHPSSPEGLGAGGYELNGVIVLCEAGCSLTTY
jgi:hypothetical protein